ncbi:ABC transporter permease [Candidatus Kaiserbacteria bacterium]|nr:ABC transporter permease [Candidatus Kaiserbacteria bacterium]
MKRVARYGLIGFVRNGFVSLAAVLIMTITLFVVAGLLILGAALGATLQQLTEKVDVTVYFETTASEEQIRAVQQSLEALPEVAVVTYVSREEALVTFRERHKNDQLTLQALEELGENPLGASLEVRAKETSQYESIAQSLDAMQEEAAASGIDKVNFYQNKTAIDRLTNIIETARRLGIAISLVLGLATVLIAFNTVRLAIYTARDEIGVMNLVGASRWYVRGPFMISGVLYGLVSGLVVLLLLYPVTLWIGPGSERFFGSFNVFSYFISSFPLIFLVVMGSGIGLGALSSYLAVRRYLHA